MGTLIAGDIAIASLARATRGVGATLAVAVSAGLLYSTLIVVAVVLHRSRGGDASFAEAYGLTWKWSDIGVGTAASIAARIAATVLILPIVALDPDLNGSNVPTRSVVEGRAALLVLLTIVAVVIAPVVEELFFRGVLQRSLEVALRPWIGVAVASIAFGLAHIDPARGRANVAVVLATTSGGAVFGALYRVLHRLPPGMVAHAMFNAVAIAVLWTVV